VSVPLSDLYFERADIQRDSLRAACTAMEAAVAQLEPTSDARVRWDAVVALLAIGPKRQLRRCPKCDGPAMHDATRCMHCWSELAPLADDALVG
jgi:hypothetical protein